MESITQITIIPFVTSRCGSRYSRPAFLRGILGTAAAALAGSTTTQIPAAATGHR